MSLRCWTPGDRFTIPSWATAAPMVAGRNHFGAVTIGGKIYLVAGQQGQDAAAV